MILLFELLILLHNFCKFTHTPTIQINLLSIHLKEIVLEILCIVPFFNDLCHKILLFFLFVSLHVLVVLNDKWYYQKIVKIIFIKYLYKLLTLSYNNLIKNLIILILKNNKNTNLCSHYLFSTYYHSFPQH